MVLLPGERVLIVDDEPAVVEVLSRHLGREGMIVCAVDDGAKAVRAVLSHRPDIVLLDILLPNLDGVVWAKEQVEVLASKGSCAA